QPGMPSPAQIERWRHARAAAAHLRWVRFLPIFALGVLVVVETVLFRTGYPLWRLAAIAAIFGGMVALALWSAQEARSVQAGGRCVSRMSMSLRASILLTLVAMSITGGLRSPLLALPLGPLADVVIQGGWGPATRRTVAAIAAGALAMALLPAWWLGPQVPQQAFWILSGVLLAV